MLASRPTTIWEYRNLLRVLVLRDLRLRYKDSTLGFAWSLLHPLLMAAVYTLAFKYIVRMQVAHFPVFLLSGLLPWIFFSSAVTAATGSIGDNGALVRKVAFPRAVLTVGVVTSQFVQFLLMYLVIVPIAMLSGVGISPALVALPPLAALEWAFATGVALACATAYVHFRDTRHLLEVLLQLWFWLTPVVYPIAMVPAAFRPWFSLNPMALFVTCYQRVVTDHSFPSPAALGVLATVAAAALCLGTALFRRYEPRFAELV